MIRPGMTYEEIEAEGAGGKISSLDPPLVMDAFQMHYPEYDGFRSAILDSVTNQGIWELRETKFFLDNIVPDGVMLDIGAHLGYFGFAVSKASGGSMEVQMFEPSADMCDAMRDTIKYNNFDGQIYIHQNAVSNEAGKEVTLRGPVGDSGSSTMVEGSMEGPNGTIASVAFEEEFTSTTMRIDDLHIPEVHLVKMDIEGYEYEAWKGMRKTLARSPNVKILLETGVYHPQEFRDEWREEYDEYVFDYDGTLAVPPEGWVDRIPATNVVLVKR
jgi:FkbM family methyltransferase